MAAFFMTHRYCPEIFQTIDGALEDVASFICLCVEARWGAALVPFTQSIFLCVESFRANTADATLLELLPIATRAVRLINAHCRRSLARSPRSRMRNMNGVKYRANLCRVAALTSSDHNG